MLRNLLGGKPPERVLADEVHRIFRDTWRAPLATLRFRRTPGYTSWSSWSRQVPQGDWQTLWVQLDQHGWTDWLGSCLTVELQQGPDTDPGSYALHGGKGDRWSRFSSHEDLAVARTMQQRVWDGSVPAHARRGESDGLRLDLLHRMSGLAGGNYEPGTDIWLLYRSREDVENWAAFLGARLHVMLQRLEAWDGDRQ